MSTDDHPGYDAARLAADPHTDWETLHRIAEDHPRLRAEIAANPNTYPELLEALASLGDPEIDAALASREDAGHQDAWADWAEEPDLSAMDSETGQFQALMNDAAEEASEGPLILEEDYYRGPRRSDARLPEEESGRPVPGPGSAEAGPGPEEEPTAHQPATWAVPAVERFDLPAREPERVQEEPEQSDAALAAALPAAAGTGAGGAGGGPAGGMLPPEGSGGSRSGSRTGLLALAIGLPVVAIVAIGALILMLLGDDEQPAAEGPPEEQDQQEPEAPEENEEDPEAEDQEATLAEARSAVQQLPESTTCGDPAEDAGTVADYAALATASGDWDSEDEELLEFTFEDLQEACDSTHAAGVFHTLRGDQESPEMLAAALDEVGVGWADMAYDASGAQNMDSFVTPDGNIHCEWDDGVRCTVLDFDYTPPSGCEDSTTYSLTVDDAGTACDDPVSEDDDRETLDHDQTAAIGVLACVSLDDRVSCYNMLDGSGFEVSERGHYTTDPVT